MRFLLLRQVSHMDAPSKHIRTSKVTSMEDTMHIVVNPMQFTTVFTAALNVYWTKNECGRFEAQHYKARH